MIKKISPRKFRVESKSKGKNGKHKNLGTFSKRGYAVRREEQVEYFKKQK